MPLHNLQPSHNMSTWNVQTDKNGPAYGASAWCVPADPLLKPGEFPPPCGSIPDPPRQQRGRRSAWQRWSCSLFNKSRERPAARVKIATRIFCREQCNLFGCFKMPLQFHLQFHLQLRVQPSHEVLTTITRTRYIGRRMYCSTFEV